MKAAKYGEEYIIWRFGRYRADIFEWNGEEDNGILRTLGE